MLASVTMRDKEANRPSSEFRPKILVCKPLTLVKDRASKEQSSSLRFQQLSQRWVTHSVICRLPCAAVPDLRSDSDSVTSLLSVCQAYLQYQPTYLSTGNPEIDPHSGLAIVRTSILSRSGKVDYRTREEHVLMIPHPTYSKRGSF
jgi:hypothetical protein